MIRCIHFGDCGGCRFQNIAYEEQLLCKQTEVEALFGLPVRPIIPCDSPWAYRNKNEYSFSQDKKGTRYLGLYKKEGRGKVLNLHECHLVAPWFQEGIEACRQWWESTDLTAYHPHKDSGSLRTLTFREGKRTGDRMVILTVSGRPEWALKKEHLTSFVEAMQARLGSGSDSLSIFLKIHQAIKGRPTEFFEMHLAGPDHYREVLDVGRKLQFHVSPSAFFQPNPLQAEKMYRLAVELIPIPQEAVIWDLYCGTGTLAIAVAPFAKEVIGIELSPESSLDARTNVKLNALSNVTIVTGDVGEALEKGNYPRPDAVMVDPPRAGLDKRAMKHLIEAKPRRIVYISCHPKTQVENCREFAAAGYRIAVIQPVDQFPHTPHIENIVLLEYPNTLE